jgi:L-fucose isomerase-like protein
VAVDLPELLKCAEEMPEEPARRKWTELVRCAGACAVPEADGLDSMRVLAAIREVVERQGLDALTIGCYPHLMGRVCLAASLLADEGIPLACEGDLNAAVAQLMLTLLTGQPTHNTDWLEPLDDGTVIFSHCGCGSFRLAEKPEQIELKPVRLMDRGVNAIFPSKPGPVTLVNLTRWKEGYRLALMEGEAVPTEMVFRGNPLRIRFSCPTDRLIDWIFTEGIGHHWMACYGHVAEPLRHWAKLAGPALDYVEAPA